MWLRWSPLRSPLVRAPYVEPIDKLWGQTVAYIIDPGGTLIEIATPVGGG